MEGTKLSPPRPWKGWNCGLGQTTNAQGANALGYPDGALKKSDPGHPCWRCLEIMRQETCGLKASASGWWTTLLWEMLIIQEHCFPVGSQIPTKSG